MGASTVKGTYQRSMVGFNRKQQSLEDLETHAISPGGSHQIVEEPAEKLPKLPGVGPG